MMILGVGTENPAKIRAVARLIEQLGLQAQIKSFAVDSGVSAMPMSDRETRRGAMNRAAAALKAEGGSDYGIGMEGGVDTLDGVMFLVNWGAVCDRRGRMKTAGGARIVLPRALADGVCAGHELGELADAYAHMKNVHSRGGTIGLLTAGRVTRSDMFLHILLLIFGLYEHDGFLC